MESCHSNNNINDMTPNLKSNDALRNKVNKVLQSNRQVYALKHDNKEDPVIIQNLPERPENFFYLYYSSSDTTNFNGKVKRAQMMIECRHLAYAYATKK